ncbi:MAG: hypothetical protein U9R51_09045 [Actinomycetota bacterium]|nr:hypothetical protein [Actinomycetota bacterium]
MIDIRRLDSLSEEAFDEIGLFDLRVALNMSQNDVAEGIAISRRPCPNLNARRT